MDLRWACNLIRAKPPAEVSICGLIDDTHTGGPELFRDAIVGDVVPVENSPASLLRT